MKKKLCFRCEDEKPINEFYAHPKMKDGLLNKCKDCTKRDVKDRRFGPNREAILAYDRERGNRWRPGYEKELRKKNPEKYKAYIISQRMPRKPCAVCGKTKRVHKHHFDYSKPKEVLFLCAAHHRQIHAGHLK